MVLNCVFVLLTGVSHGAFRGVFVSDSLQVHLVWWNVV